MRSLGPSILQVPVSWVKEACSWSSPRNFSEPALLSVGFEYVAPIRRYSNRCPRQLLLEEALTTARWWSTPAACSSVRASREGSSTWGCGGAWQASGVEALYNRHRRVIVVRLRQILVFGHTVLLGRGVRTKRDSGAAAPRPAPGVRPRSWGAGGGCQGAGCRGPRERGDAGGVAIRYRGNADIVITVLTFAC